MLTSMKILFNIQKCFLPMFLKSSDSIESNDNHIIQKISSCELGYYFNESQEVRVETYEI